MFKDLIQKMIEYSFDIISKLSSQALKYAINLDGNQNSN